MVLVATHAWADLEVTVSQPSPENELAARKLVTELRSEGYSVHWLSYPVETPCAPSASSRVSAAAGIWIELGSTGAQRDVAAIICYRPTLGPVDRATVSAPFNDPQRLAIVAVEALNGMRSAPRQVDGPARAAAPSERGPCDACELRRSALLAVGASGVLDVTGAGPLLGAEIRLASSLNRALAAEAEVFLPVLAAREVGADRILWVRTAWLRLALRHRWPAGRAELNADVALGSALVWARSEPEPPLVGTTALTPAALLSAGFGFVYPREAPFGFYANIHASRLVPYVKLTIDDDHTRAFGALLLDGALGLEMRW